jgi:exodeoxyribonuclease VII large subunit
MIPVQGEISTLSRPASGHIYFTLKDQSSQVRCAMFKGSLVRNKYIPKQGDEVVALGRVSLYEGRGDYQLIVNSIQPVGAGALQAAFFQMKERLAAEGLFDEAHKQHIPEFIKTVGIVTSSTGAALHDILTVLNRRYPAMNIILYPSQVQGNEATATIVEAIETANRRNEVDVLIVGRGGGSLEDLWCFNTEPVARAIHQSTLPIISAVGHEVDVSISDFVADQRAATPSQAAEMISPDQFELMQKIDQKEQRLVNAIQNQLSWSKKQLSITARRLRNPSEILKAWQEKLTLLNNRLTLAIKRPLNELNSRVMYLSNRIQLTSPQKQIETDHKNLVQLTQRLERGVLNSLEPKRSKFQKLVSELNLLSPLSTLDRGYSITKDSNGTVVQNVSQLKKNDEIETLLRTGTVVSVVKSAK